MTPPAPLPPEDQIRFHAAQGWLGLQDAPSARDELAELTPPSQTHPEVLKLQWWIGAVERDWLAAATAAKAVIRLLPDEAEGWVHHSVALHKLQRTTEARALLRAVVERFPDDPVLLYNLACYECQLGQLPAARERLCQALTLSARADLLKRNALEDADLEPLWPVIPSL
jgi:predicted Zn-dependent protease